MESPPDFPSPSSAPAAPVADAAPAGRLSPGRLLLVALGLLAVLLLAVWADARSRMGDMREELARRLADGDNAVREQRAQLRQDRDSLEALQGRVVALEAKLAESQSQALALEAMYQELSRSRDERLLAEVEQSVAIAAQQLQLAGNVEAALIALQAADARLARANQPKFLPARRLITRDIDRLKALPAADVSGLSLKLESLVAGVETLPLAYERRPRGEAVRASTDAATRPADLSYWRRLAIELWDDVRQLVRIERVDQGDAALLAPGQAFFLRENLKLRLLAARLALLQRDSRAWREELRQARESLERYFDGQARPVQAALASLKSLAAADVGSQAMGVSGLAETQTALRNLKLSPEKAR